MSAEEKEGGATVLPLEDVKNKRLLVQMNKDYAVVLDNGKVRVLYFETMTQQIGTFKNVRHVPMFLEFEGFRNWHCNKFVNVVGGKEGEVKVTPLGTWWIRHPQRKQYEGLTFEPGKPREIEGKLNLWRGWGVTPKQGDWSLLREHMRLVMTDGKADAFTYLMNWLAWSVQHPDTPPEVAIVFKGARGAGKGILGNTMCRLFGQHSVQISDAKHMGGAFNAHLRATCFLFADEAYWPGDKSAEGNLKRLITEPTIFIEAKGRDGIQVRNMIHVLMATNEQWAVPAGESERRFVIWLVNKLHMQDHAWFKAIHEQLENGGYEGMLHDLLNMDLGGWHPRNIANSGGEEELLDQQRQSLDPLDAYWVELLETGILEGADPQAPHMAVSSQYEREIEETGANGNTYIRRVRQDGVMDQAKKIEPRLRQRNSHIIGRYLAKQGCDNSKLVLRRRGWTFPPLDKLRAEWMKRWPTWVWRNPDLKEWRYEIHDGADVVGGSTEDDIPF